MQPEFPSFSDFYHPSLNIHHLLTQLEKVMKQYLIRIVFVSEVSCKFSFVTFNLAPLLGVSFSFSDLIPHQILTNIPFSMTSTIFLSICRFISIFASVLFCRQSLKPSSRYPHTRSTCIRPCRRGAWKIRKRCQGSGSRAKYLTARKFHFKFLVLSDCVE